MNKFVLTLGAIGALVAVSGSPAAARTHYHRHHVRYVSQRTYSNCGAEHHQAANNGTVIGAIAGGVIGNRMAEPGSRGLGTVLGAGGGAVVGHQIGAHSHRC